LPRSGKIDFDIDGNASGNWFLVGTNWYQDRRDRPGKCHGCTFMGQLERGLNRLYGVEQDRPALLFQWSPRRRQPAWSWLAFGETYGPLAGIAALMLWSLLSGVALLFGAALGAQLEAVRAGAAAPVG
jgi:hypothetical protein